MTRTGVAHDDAMELSGMAAALRNIERNPNRRQGVCVVSDQLVRYWVPTLINQPAIVADWIAWLIQTKVDRVAGNRLQQRVGGWMLILCDKKSRGT